MKLWDSLTTCLILLSAVCAGTLIRRERAGTGTARALEAPLVPPPVQIHPNPTPLSIKPAEREIQSNEEKYTMEEPLPHDFEDVMDFIKVTISRIHRPSSSSTFSSPSPPSAVRESLNGRTRHRRERKKGAKPEKSNAGRRRAGEANRRSRGGRGQDCVLKQIHLNVSDLGLGHRSGEEMIFRYCSGPCRKPESNYDKILSNLVHNKKLPSKDTSVRACCRPVAFDDDLSFLDDSLVYHTVRKHSARKCGCV